jgi:3-hydroxyacyl-CoA dehydrogenase/enoyl-CoA hydratase/3-hydroxybutyryl-CoA epimerase
MAFFQARNLWINQLADGVAALVLDVPDRKVNVLSREVFSDLKAALTCVAESPFELLLVRSGKPASFCAGADLQEIAALRSAEEAVALATLGQETFNQLAHLKIPTVAVIAGTCLGGGLELALACDYRVVVDKPNIQLGLPELELGLIPGWGGTQRLPRLIGLERAMQVILAGRRLGAREAFRWRLADDLTQTPEDEAPAFLAEPAKRPMHRLPLYTWRQRLLESNPLGRWLLFHGARRLLRRRVPDDLPAPWEALEALRVGLKRGLDAGLEYERAALGRLALEASCQNLVRLFFQREQARKARAEQRDFPAIRKVGIVGADVLGAALAHLAALRGCQVTIREASEMGLGLAMLRLMTLFKDSVQRGLMSQADLPRRLAGIHGTTAWKGFDDLDLVIEAVEEDEEKKKEVLSGIEKNTAASTLVATTAAAMRVQDLQQDLKHPERLAGLHFPSPVQKMPLVEVVRTPATVEQTAVRLADWVATLGKTALFVKDTPGFLIHRMLMPYLNEAVLLLREGMRIGQVDETMRRFGMTAGPLEFLDQLGLDVTARLAESLQPVFGGRLELDTAFAELAESGWLGQKSGSGFYRYDRRRPRENGVVLTVVRGGAPSLPLATGRAEEVMAAARERLVLLLVNEAGFCLDEGVVADAESLDLGMVLGAGFAPHRGGPLRYAEQRGYKAVVEALRQMAEYLGPRFQPCAALERLAERTSSELQH